MNDLPDISTRVQRLVCYNAGRAIGSVFMTAIGFATAIMPLGSAIALFSTLAHLLMIIMLMMLPETRGRAIANWMPRRQARRQARAELRSDAVDFRRRRSGDRGSKKKPSRFWQQDRFSSVAYSDFATRYA